MIDRSGPHGPLTIVIKVGTSSLVRPEHNTLNLSNLARLCEVVRELKTQQHRVVIVSSGAVGVGAQRLGLNSRPSKLSQKQALAAVGQVHLMRFYDDFFSAIGLTCAQVLLSLGNLASRIQYLNASNTFTELFSYGTVPIVNENDTVAVEELRIGDNDTLSAQVATMVRADWLFLLTDVPCLYTANPSTDPSAEPIHEVRDIAALQVDTGTPGSQWGTGGMATKLTAARLTTAAGCHMAICEATRPESIAAILRGEKAGTVFYPQLQSLKGRKRWILSVPVKGSLRMDAGAVRAVEQRSKSLFSAGIVAVSGDFSAQDAVALCNAAGRELGRGLCNYSAAEVDKIKGVSSKDFVNELGYLGCEEIVHRDNICLLQRPDSNLSEANLKEAGNNQSSRDPPNGVTSEEGRQQGNSDTGSDQEGDQESMHTGPKVQKEDEHNTTGSQPDADIADADCFQDQESEEGFKFSGIPIPSRGRPASEDLASRLAILRNRHHAEPHNKADSLARHAWAGEYSSSVPSRVHVLHSIEEKRWHEDLDLSLKTASQPSGHMRTNSDVMERLRQIREREPDAAGPSDEEHKDWIARLAHASAAERASEDASVAEAGSRGRVSSPPCSPAQLGEAGLPMGLPAARPPWKASSQQAIPLKGRRQHGSSNALSLMHMSPSPANCQTLDIGDGGWLPR